jgi:hypothetical protein
MADEIEVRFRETTEESESAEQTDARRLDDATFEPQALVEQTGEYRQAEAIQDSFVALMDNAAAEATAASGAEQASEAQAPAIDGREDTVAGREPRLVEGVFEKTPNQSGGDNASITPINLPDVGPKLPGGGDSGRSAEAAGREDTVAGREPKIVEGAFEKAPGGDEGGGEDITPINLPNIHETVGDLGAAETAEVQSAADTPGIKFRDAAGTPQTLRSSGEDAFPEQFAGEVPAAPVASTDAPGIKFWNGGEVPAALRREQEQTGYKFYDEAGVPAELGQAQEQTGYEIDSSEAQSAQQSTDTPGIKFWNEGEVPAELRQGQEQTGYKFYDEAGVPEALRQGQEQTGYKFNDEAGVPAELGQAQEQTGYETDSSEAQSVQQSTDTPGIKFWNEGEVPAALRQGQEQTGYKFYDEAGVPEALRQGQEQAGYKFYDEAGVPAELRQAQEQTAPQSMDAPGIKFWNGGEVPAELRQGQEQTGYKFYDEAGVPAALHQGQEQTGYKFYDEAGVPATLDQSPELAGGKTAEREAQAKLSRAEETGSAEQGPVPAGSRLPEAGVSPADGQSIPTTSETETSSPPETGESLGASVSTAVGPGTKVEDTAEKNLGEGEATGEWSPPEMYVSIGPDGECIIVDADGEPIDSPPIVKQMAGDKGQAVYFGMYAELDSEKRFWIPYLERNFQGCSVGFNPDGELAVFDANGKPLSAQPKIQKTFDADGYEAYMVYNVDSSGNATPITLLGYTGSLDGVSIYKNADGKRLAVDSSGQPLAVQPQIVVLFGPQGEEVYSVWYPTSKSLMSKPVMLTAYSASLEGVFVHVAADGKATAVDKDGNPLTAQPKILEMEDGTFMVSYAGMKQPVTVGSYTASLEGVTVYKGADGKLTAVDSNGKALASQPLILTEFDAKGNAIYRIWYGETEYSKSEQIKVQGYTASLSNVFISLDQNGNPVAVDESGKPLAAQPLFQRFDDVAKNTVFRAYYPGGQSVWMDYYLPESGGLGTSQYLWK